jgi:hypothetical protein
LFTEQCQTSLNKKRYIWPFPWPNRSERSNCWMQHKKFGLRTYLTGKFW